MKTNHILLASGRMVNGRMYDDDEGAAAEIRRVLKAQRVIVTGPALTTVMAEVEEQPRALRVGDRIGEWELAAVKGRSITFSKGGERHVIELPYVHTAPASPAGAADAPPLPAGMPARPPQGRPAQGVPPPSSFRPQF